VNLGPEGPHDEEGHARLTQEATDEEPLVHLVDQ
jgi:hypothetical protein